MKRNVPDPSGTGALPLRFTLVRAALRKQEQAGIYCKPTVSLEFQRQSRVYVVRGVESGGATAELGHYVVFCGLRGERVSWLQPLQSVASNGPQEAHQRPWQVAGEGRNTQINIHARLRSASVLCRIGSRAAGSGVEQEGLRW